MKAPNHVWGIVRLDAPDADPAGEMSRKQLTVDGATTTKGYSFTLAGRI